MKPIWYDSTEAGAPVLNNAVGSMVEVLRACLVTGFNTRSVTSIVVASEVATATAATHGFQDKYGKLLRIEGAPDAGLNGDIQPLNTTTNTFQYACPGVADGTYTGTITARRTPLGWAEDFTGTGKAIFSRTDPAATASKLQVIDTNTSPASATHAWGGMIDSATDVDTVSGLASSTGNLIAKGANSATAKEWALVGDGLAFYLINGYKGGVFFGDPLPLYPADGNSCTLIASENTITYYGIGEREPSSVTFAGQAPSNSFTFHRSMDGTLLGEKFRIAGTGSFGREGLAGTAVVPITGEYYMVTSTTIRARCPGLYAPQADAPFVNRQVYDLATSKKLVCLNMLSAGTNDGQIMLDLSSDWRT